MDYEPSLWSSTHRDIYPIGLTMDEIKTRIVQYASMIKSIDPTALVVGPEEWVSEMMSEVLMILYI